MVHKWSRNIQDVDAWPQFRDRLFESRARIPSFDLNSGRWQKPTEWTDALRKLEIAPKEFAPIEDALALIFDPQPFMKTSSVVHENSAVGIRVGSRNEKTLTEEFVERVKLATAKLRQRSKVHYKIIFEWYQSNDIQIANLNNLGINETEIENKWHEALRYIFNFVYKNHVSHIQVSNLETEREIKSGDRAVIVEGPIKLIGEIVQIVAVLSYPEVVYRYFERGRECMLKTNIKDLRSID